MINFKYFYVKIEIKYWIVNLLKLNMREIFLSW
jgi:hypothetical protein